MAAFGPEWVIVIVLCALIAVVTIKAIPTFEKFREQRMEIAKNESEARIDLERQREARKAEEEKSREQRDRERSEAEGHWAAQNDRAIRAQEQANAVVEALTKQMQIMNAQMQDSKLNSSRIGERLEDMSDKVDDLHRHLIK